MPSPGLLHPGGRRKTRGDDAERIAFVEGVPNILPDVADAIGPYAGILDLVKLVDGNESSDYNDEGRDDGSSDDSDREPRTPAPPQGSKRSSGNSPGDSGPSSAVPSCHNCAEAVFDVDSAQLQTLGRRFPNFFIDASWNIMMNSPEPPHAARRIARLRCLGGSSIRADCYQHSGTCKLYLDIKGKFEHCQCRMLLWAIQGTTCRVEDHRALARRMEVAWRAA